MRKNAAGCHQLNIRGRGANAKLAKLSKISQISAKSRLPVTRRQANSQNAQNQAQNTTNITIISEMRSEMLPAATSPTFGVGGAKAERAESGMRRNYASDSKCRVSPPETTTSHNATRKVGTKHFSSNQDRSARKTEVPEHKRRNRHANSPNGARRERTCLTP